MKVLYRGPTSLDEETKECPRCKGDGFEDEYDGEVCRRCWGDGEVLVDSAPSTG
jgi:DnaJ-class molecular chaperone